MPAMAYPVKYVRTSDGVNIAHTEYGVGEPLLCVQAIPWANFSVMLSSPYTARHPEQLGTFAKVTLYDPRGMGLSDHSAEDLSLEGFARDIDALSLGLGQPFTLYGLADGTRIAMYYAATRPERIKNLVLWLPSLCPARLSGDPVLRVISGLAYREWQTFVRTMSHAVVGGWDAEGWPYADAFADIMRGGVRQEEFARVAAAMRQHDVSEVVSRVAAPTLVMTRESAAVYTVDVVREVAAAIPGAEFVCPPGNWLLPCTDDDITTEVARFMATSFSREKPSERPLSSQSMAETVAGGKLSAREWEVVQLVARGMTNAEIADELLVSHATASRHLHNILTKLGMTRRSEIAVFAAMSGRVPAPN